MANRQEAEYYEHTQGPYKKYSSKYSRTARSWEYNSWQSPPPKQFNLNGLPGCICTLSLPRAGSDFVVQVEFSNTQEIEVMEVICKISNHFLYRNYDKSIPNLQTYRIPNLNTHLSYGEFHIVIEVTIMKTSNELYRLNPPAVSTAVAAPNYTATNIAARDNAVPSIVAALNTFFEQKTLCDVTFVVEDEKFYAHKVVLATQSKVFEAMFLSDMKEQKDNVIDISDTKPEVFHQFLNYLYSGKITELEKVVEEMIVIADFYDVSHLKLICEKVLLKSLSEDSVVRYVILADKLNCDALKKKALSFIRKSAVVFEKTILEEDIATIMCLKEILSNNQPQVQTKVQPEKTEQ